MAYTEVTISSYNATPPTDDGASGATNTITWSKIKTKLGDPLNTAIASIDDNVATACGSLDTSITTAESNITTISSNINTEEAALSAPSATELFFVQTAAPTGWTKITTHNDKALRLVSGTVSTGGSTAFTSVFASRTITDTEIPSHSHTVSDSGSLSLNRSSWTNSASTSTHSFSNDTNARVAYKQANSDSSSFGATISFSGTTGSAGSGTAMDFAVQYVDIILASKN